MEVSGWFLVQKVALALLLFGLGWVFSGWAAVAVRTMVDRRNLDQALGRFAAHLTRWTLVAVAAITALGTLGIETLTVAALFAAAGIAIGLAVQGSLSNFASGVLLLVFRPFDVGDRVEAGGATGVCEEIGLFGTTLISPRNETVIVPNSAITSGTIVNYSRRGTLRVAIEVAVVHGSRVDAVVETLGRAARRSPLVLADPAPEVSCVGLGPSGLAFALEVSSKAADLAAMQHQVRAAVLEELGSAGIELPLHAEQ